MVSSGTSSKQVASEGDAQYVGYGAMLLEGGLAVIVILACCAGIGMGIFNRTGTGANYTFQPIVKAESAAPLTNQEAWKTRYATSNTVTNADGTTRVVGGWASHSLKAKVSAFVDGGGNFLASLGIPLKMSIAIMAVLVASFAATTLDTATRLQRYVIHELAQTVNFKPLTNRYTATAFALVLAAAVALLQGPSGPGSGGTNALAPLWRDKSALGGISLYGHRLLSPTSRQTDLVRVSPHGRYVDYACVGNASSDVQSGDGVALYRSIFTFRIRCCCGGVADMDGC